MTTSDVRNLQRSHQLGVGVAQAQPADELRVGAKVLAPQVLQQRPPLGDDGLQAAAAGIVLLVDPHVLRQLRDARRQPRHCEGVRRVMSHAALEEHADESYVACKVLQEQSASCAQQSL